ncbi:26031_t:CDS:2, partial [Dentiscutata erythropus]
MWFDMPRNLTLEFEGVREVLIKTTGSNKVRFTVVLEYTASGDKLLPTVIRARPNGFFKNKGAIFVDNHRSYTHDDVVKALNSEGLDVLEILGGMTSVLQPPDVSEISKEVLIKSFESTRLTLNPDGSENNKISYRLQAIVRDRMNEIDELSSEERDKNMMNIDV